MRWVELVNRWKAALAKRFGRSEDEIVSEALGDGDFPSSGVRIRFEDGSDLVFRHAFYLVDVRRAPPDGRYLSSRVAVFSAHCGYHEFWIGPGDTIDDCVDESGLAKDKSVSELKGMFAAPADACVLVADMNPLRKKS